MKKLNSFLSSWAGLAGVCTLLGFLTYTQVQIYNIKNGTTLKANDAFKIGDQFPSLEGYIVGGGKENLPTSGFFYFYSPSCHWCTENAGNLRIVSQKVSVIGISLQDIGTTEYIKEHEMKFDNYVKVKSLPAVGTPMFVEVSGGMVTDVTTGAWLGGNKGKIEKRFDVVLGR